MERNILFEEYFGIKDKYTLIKVNEQKLDHHVAPDFKSELVIYFGNSNNINLNTCLDLSKVDYIDSSGLAALLALRRLCRKVGQCDPALVVKKDEAVERLLENSQVGSLFNILHNINEL